MKTRHERPATFRNLRAAVLPGAVGMRGLHRHPGRAQELATPWEEDLQEGTLRRFDASEIPFRLECETGLLWITQDNSGDVLLHPGESFFPQSQGLVLVQALVPSRMSVF